MYFKNRQDAGKLLAQALIKYKGKEVVVFALPRGGVVTAVEIAKALKAPLDLILAHKIGHPYHSEYAIAAISESGFIVSSSKEMQTVDKNWLEAEKKRQLAEIKRKREQYLKNREEISLKDKIAILVDDGIATGLTMQAGILELRHRQPKKIVVAVPVAPRSSANLLATQADEFVGIEVAEDYDFLGAVGAYYQDFSQTEDEEVIDILETHGKEIKK